jgi:starch synthase (maltosyl-transferring)
MRLYENDRWPGSCKLAKNARYEYTIEAWTDEFGTWRAEVGKKVDAGQDVKPELVEGHGIVEDAFERSHDRRLGRRSRASMPPATRAGSRCCARKRSAR